MENNLPCNFTNLLLALQYRKTYQRSLDMAREKFNLKQTSIEDLTPFKTLELYRTVVRKFYMNRTKIIEGSWFQNELRVYLWLLIGYLFIHKKSINQMDQTDWAYFTPIFHQRPPVSFEFQAFSLLPNSRSPKWLSTEIQLLQSIIKQKKFKNKWNSVARELFIRSNKQNYRTPKQCRERWLNYLDPAKKRTGWDKTEDLILLKTVMHSGKKWSTAVRILKGSRTEHMVKNRYKSMVANEMKKHQNYSQSQTVILLIRQIEKELYDSREVLLGEQCKNTRLSYLQSCTQNSALKEQSQMRTATDYPQNLANFSSIRNPTQLQFPMSTPPTPPSNHTLSPFQPSKPSSKPLYLHEQLPPLPDENQFLMSHEEIQDYMLFNNKEKESLMKDEDIEEKADGNHNYDGNGEFLDKNDRINYFSEEFNVGDCFR